MNTILENRFTRTWFSCGVDHYVDCLFASCARALGDGANTPKPEKK